MSVPSGARCVAHGDVPAVDVCGRCGAFVCRACTDFVGDDAARCVECRRRQPKETVAPLEWAAGGLVAPFMLVPLVGPLGACGAPLLLVPSVVLVAMATRSLLRGDSLAWVALALSVAPLVVGGLLVIAVMVSGR